MAAQPVRVQGIVKRLRKEKNFEKQTLDFYKK
jgi:hypothetical protein